MNNLWSVRDGDWYESGSDCSEADEGIIVGIIEEGTDAELEGVEFNPPSSSSFGNSFSGAPSQPVPNMSGRRFSLGNTSLKSFSMDGDDLDGNIRGLERYSTPIFPPNQNPTPTESPPPAIHQSCGRIQIGRDPPSFKQQFRAQPDNNQSLRPPHPLGSFNKYPPLNRSMAAMSNSPQGPPMNISMRRLPAMRNQLNSSFSNPSSRFASHSNCRRDNQSLRDMVRGFNPNKRTLDAQPRMINPTNFSSVGATCERASRPMSALQANFERQAPSNLCMKPSSITGIKNQLNNNPPNNPYQFGNNSPPMASHSTPKHSLCHRPKFEYSPFFQSHGGLNPSNDGERVEQMRSNLPTLITSVTSFMVPESVGEEVCIKTPVQVEIVKSNSNRNDVEALLRSNANTCHAHRAGGAANRFNYSEYARVHDLNCSGINSIFKHAGVPNLCGSCIPPPPPSTRRRSMTCGGAYKPNFHSDCGAGSGSGIPGIRSYEEIKKHCEEKVKEDNEKKCEAGGTGGGGVGETIQEAAKDVKSNFLSIIKDFRNAIGNVGSEKTPTPEAIVSPPPAPPSTAPTPKPIEKPVIPTVVVTPPVPEIIVTAPTPEREMTPAMRTERERSKSIMEGLEQSKQPPYNVAPAAFGHFSRSMVGSTPNIIQNHQAIPKIVISDWDMPKIVLEEGQQDSLGLPTPTDLTSECGICRKYSRSAGCE